MKKMKIAAIGVVLLSFAIGIYFYGQVPDIVPSHWNMRGEVDGYMPKFWGMFLVPLLMGCCLLLFEAIPRMDPLKANIEKFRKHYERFIVLILLFFLYIYMLSLFWTMGMSFNMTQALSPAFCILFFYCGILIANAKQNWFIGIRTPWTMSSESVWNKTHRIGGKLFKAAGIISLCGILVPDYAIFIVLAPVILFSVYLVVYSYLEYKKEKRA